MKQFILMENNFLICQLHMLVTLKCDIIYATLHYFYIHMYQTNFYEQNYDQHNVDK